MHVIVIGCGRVGSSLAYQLYKEGNEVTVIDRSVTAFENLPADFEGRIVEGDALARDVLRRAEIENAEGLAAVTGSESINVVLAHVARSVFKLPNVVVRSFDPSWSRIHESFGVQAIGSARWDVQRMEEMLTQPSVRILFSRNNTSLAVYEFVVPKGWQDRNLQDALPESQYHVLWCSRAGLVIPLEDLQTLEQGDVIYLTANQEGIAKLRNRLSSNLEA